VDVGDVQELHGRTLKCRNGVGWNPARLTDPARFRRIS
jgi:hypothetical protein